MLLFFNTIISTPYKIEHSPTGHTLFSWFSWILVCTTLCWIIRFLWRGFAYVVCQGNIVGMNTGGDVCQTQLQVLVWQKPCFRVDAVYLSVWVLWGEMAPAPAQSCVDLPLLRTSGHPMSLERQSMAAASHLGLHQSWVLLGSVQGNDHTLHWQCGAWQEKGYVCACGALLHTHSKCCECFPRANKLNLAAEGRWCLLSLHQAEK